MRCRDRNASQKCERITCEIHKCSENRHSSCERKKLLLVRYLYIIYVSKATDTLSVCNASYFSMERVVKYTHFSVKFIFTLPVLLPPVLCVFR
jgi:hypothetical protein